MNTYIWFLMIATVIGMILYVILHKEDGVVQQVKVYGNEYKIKTLVYIGGKLIDGWYDVATDEKEFKRIKKNRKEQAEDFHKTLTFQK